MSMLLRRALPLLLLCGFASTASAQAISLTGSYTQNFDTLASTAGSTTNNLTLTGWSMTEAGGGARDNEQYGVDTGGSNTGDTYSYGAAGNAERALGGLRSGTLVPLFGACFTNNTGATLTSLPIAYTGEQWRLGTAGRTDQLNFEYRVGATGITDGGAWTGVAALNFTTPSTAGTAGARDGNAAGYRTALSSTITGVSIANGSGFCIRWTDTDASGADDGLAIDDFSVTLAAAPLNLSVNDVSVTEGNSGTTTATFTVSLSSAAPAGGVSFDIATADGSATAGSDYIARSLTGQTIPAGSSSYTFAVTINGDTAMEPNETFFVNVANVVGATAADAQGLGTILNDDVTTIAVVQGSGITSPFVGSTVAVEGIVTALKFNNGFFLQSADAETDADPATSEGIFVFTGSAPTVAVGQRVRVSGTAVEFTPSTNPNQLSITQISAPTVTVLSSGHPLPTPVALTTADFSPSSTVTTAERLEGMRVRVASGRVVGPSEGTISESTASATSNGVFYMVLAGVPRPFREPGISVLDVIPIPAGKTPPRFDANPERIMVRSRGQVGAAAIAVDVEATVTDMSGVLDYFSGTWALLPDVGSGTVSGGMAPRPVSDPAHEDATIGSFNLLRFFDEVNDANGGPTLTAAALDKRLRKASLAICDYLKAPDILGVVEVENLRVLGLLADRVNGTCARGALYQPYLIQGNDVGGINVGFLANAAPVAGGAPRVEVVDVQQFGKDATLANPDGSTSLLNDRPPLRLKAIIHHANGAAYPVTVIVNHLRSLNGIDDTAAGSNGWSTDGARVRGKRAAQAAYLAGLVHQWQQTDPNEKIVLVGDFNAFEFNDGYVDVMGIIRGDEAPEPQVLTYYDSPVTRPLIDGSQLIADPLQRYSYVFEGNAQTLDHVLVNEPLILQDYARVEHARIDADFSVHWFAIDGTPQRVSDHDPLRLAITVDAFHTADLSAASSAPATLPVGSTAQFTATIGNAGPSSALNVAAAFVFDALVQPMVTAPTGWTCDAPVQDATAATTTVTCRIAELAANAIAAFTIDVPITAALRDRPLRMAVSVTSQSRDPDATNNGSVASGIAAGEADVWSHLTGRDRILVGQPYTYAMRVANNGPYTAWAPVAVLRGDAPAASVKVGAAPAGWSCTVTGTASTFEVRCMAERLDPGIFQYIQVQIVTPSRTSGGQYLTLTSQIQSGSMDRVPGNNTDSLRALISGVR